VLTPEVRALAETPDRYTLLAADVVRTADERVCVLEGSTWANVAGVRVDADEVETLLAEVRTLVPYDKRVSWWIGPSTAPPDLHERLVALGLAAPTDRATIVHALACTTPPPPGPPGVQIRPVEGYDDYLTSIELMWDAFSTREERRARERPHLRGMFDAAQAAGVPRSFLASVDGRPAATARSIYSDRGVFLIAGAVAPWARGRGLYRALVRARWDDAVSRGTPALVTGALPGTSYPILKRLGFEDVCMIRRLEDQR
jgi:hypothetical protein